MQVGIHELKAHWVAYLDRVKAGETITLMERGRPVARLVPVEEVRVPAGLAALIAAGKIRWSGRKRRCFTPLPVEPSEKTIAEMVSEDRR